MRIPSAFDLHHSAGPSCRGGEASGCFHDVSCEAINAPGTCRGLCVRCQAEGRRDGQLAHKWSYGHYHAGHYRARSELNTRGRQHAGMAFSLQKERLFFAIEGVPLRKDQNGFR